MNRIDKKFLNLRKEGKMAFMPFVVAGDPSFAMSIKIIKTLLKYADLLEIGFPYSDPLADGPVIQAADERALKAGMNTDKVFELITKVRFFSETPITVLVYANLVEQRGLEKFYKDAKKAGVDGILIPDVPLEEIEPYIKVSKKFQIRQILMASQTTDNERLKKISKLAKGYIYLVTILGTTGVRAGVEQVTLDLINKVKVVSNLPLAAGFGISKKSQVDELGRAGANGFIIGSRIIKILEGIENNERILYERLISYLNAITGK